MGFLSGRVTALRFKVAGTKLAAFTEEHLDRLKDRCAGRQRVATADGIETGWTASDHVLDTDFTLEKNVVNDALLFDLRVDTDRIPGDLLKAYYAVEVKALAKNNPSGFPSAKQKREAKEIARDRLEQEAKDGRYKKRKCIPVMWDARSNEVLFGVTSLTQVDRLTALFEQTFGTSLNMCLTAGVQSRLLPEHAYARFILERAADWQPALSPFIPGVTPTDVAWIADESNRDFLGNEFLLWLWYVADLLTDTLALPDKSEATFMFARKLLLDCPRGQSGIDGFKTEGPAQLPEARRAIQAGKLPRLAGFTVVRNSEQFEYTLSAETFAISGARLPNHDDTITEVRAKLEARVDSVRSLLEVCDLMYGSFLKVRLSAKGWEGTLAGMQKWLKREERGTADPPRPVKKNATGSADPFARKVGEFLDEAGIKYEANYTPPASDPVVKDAVNKFLGAIPEDCTVEISSGGKTTGPIQGRGKK